MFVTKDKVNGFVFDKTVGLVTVLVANFVIQQGRNVNLRDNVKPLAKDVIEELEAFAFGASHKALLGAVTTMAHGFLTSATSGNASQNRDNQKGDCGNSSNDNKNNIHNN